MKIRERFPTAGIPLSHLATALLFSLAYQLTLQSAESNPGAQRLKNSLADTQWLWYGREDRVVTLRKDGTFAMDDWERQGIVAEWEATASRIVTVTVTGKKFRNLTASLLFADDLQSFTGTDLDKNRVISKSPRVFSNGKTPMPVADLKQLSGQLGNTRWLWHGRKDFPLELRKDGTFALDAWKVQGIEANWKATGEREVTVTVTSHKFKGFTATLIFDDALKSFTGTDLDKNRRIITSPRIR